MFHAIYTDYNNRVSNESEMKDPLNLARCLRLYPHDDNQGGFFVAVFEKLASTDKKLAEEDLADPWMNSKIREKPILDDLAEFSAWYEELYKKHCEENNIPVEEREKLGMSDMVELAKLKEKTESEAMGIPCGSLSEQKKQKSELQEQTEFPYSNLVKAKPETWFNILDFYGIDFSFPSDYLYRHSEGKCKNIVLLNKGLHDLMSSKKKFKYSVVNLGLKVFSKNRESKSEGDYRIMQEALDVLLPYMDDRR